MRFLTARTIHVLVLHAIGVLGIGVLVVALPICNAAAWSPLADDERTIVEHRSVTTVETEPGVRYLHARSVTGTCQDCVAPTTDDHTAPVDTIVERFAAPAIAPVVTVPESSEAAHDTPIAASSRVLAPDVAPPRSRTIVQA